MQLSESEVKILHKFYDICFVSLDDHIYTGYFYDVISKNYLWKTISLMEKKGIINSYIEGRKKYIYLSSKGKIICKSLNVIRKI